MKNEKVVIFVATNKYAYTRNFQEKGHTRQRNNWDVKTMEITANRSDNFSQFCREYSINVNREPSLLGESLLIIVDGDNIKLMSVICIGDLQSLANIGPEKSTIVFEICQYIDNQDNRLSAIRILQNLDTLQNLFPGVLLFS